VVPEGQRAQDDLAVLVGDDAPGGWKIGSPDADMAVGEAFDIVQFPIVRRAWKEMVSGIVLSRGKLLGFLTFLPGTVYSV
jgi:hypothetical protein